MKLAIHSPRSSYYTGGAERYTLNLTRNLIKLGIDTYLITYDAPRKSEWFKEFYVKFRKRVVLLKSKDLDKEFDLFRKATVPKIWDKESIIFSKLSKKFYENSNFTNISYHYAVDCLGAPNGKKIHLHLHGLPDKKRVIENRAIKIPDQIIAVSKFVASGWKELHKTNKKVHIVYNGINLEEINKHKTRKKNIEIISYGRLIKIKGIESLIKSLSILKKENIKFNCKIIGDGPEKERLINLSNKLNLSDSVEFLGKLKDKNLFNYVSRSKIAVFASYRREGVLTTLLESAVLKTAIISSDACSNVEIIKNNKNGVIFKARNYQDLSSKIKLLLKNDVLRGKIVKKMAGDVRMFSWKRQAKKIYSLYLSLK